MCARVNVSSLIMNDYISCCESCNAISSSVASCSWAVEMDRELACRDDCVSIVFLLAGDAGVYGSVLVVLLVGRVL